MTHYVYASGIIKALESRLVPKAKIHQLAESATQEEFFRNLSDTVYGGLESEIFTPESCSCFVAELTKLAASLIKDELIRDFFVYENDLLNLRAVIKSIKQGLEPPEEAPSPEGKIGYKSMIGRIKEKKYFLLPELLSICCEELLDSKKEHSPLAADSLIDEIYFRWALENNSGDEVFVKYVKLRIDALNILNLLRARFFFAATEYKQRASLFIGGGQIDRGVFISALRESIKISDFLKGVKFFEFSPQFENMEFGADIFSEFSKFYDDSITYFWSRERLKPFGFHLVSGYIHAKNMEMKNLRMINSSILGGVSTQERKKRIRESYI